MSLYQNLPPLTRFFLHIGQDQSLLTVFHFYSGSENLIHLKHHQSHIKRGKLSLAQNKHQTFPNEDGSLKTAFPFMPAYAPTIPKALGQTLNECIVWLDSPIVAPGGAYVALSHCRKLENIHFLTHILSSPVTPVSLL